MSRWRFQPPRWAWVITPPLCAGLAALGAWQWHRGEAKAALLASYVQADTREPQALDGASRAADGLLRAARARGEYLVDRQLLLDNQTLRRVPGHHAWTPLRLEDGGLLMVNRGWVAAGADRSQLTALPAPTGKLEVRGYWRTLPRPGLRSGEGNCVGDAWPRLVNYPTLADLQCLYPAQRIAEGVLLLDAAAPGGFAREWAATVVDLPPERHYGYAFQWFALALTLAAIFIKLNLKKQT